MGKHLLIVDDDERFRTQLERAMTRRGLVVTTAENYDTALDALEAKTFDMATLDLRMPGRNGLCVLRDLTRDHPDIQTVVLTGYGSIATAIDAVNMGATNYVQKPADADDILAAFERGKTPLEPATMSYEAPTLARLEWEHINRVMADCGGNVSEAARRLGIHRRTLQRKLAAYPPKT